LKNSALRLLGRSGFVASRRRRAGGADLDERGAKVVIAQHPRRAAPHKIDADIYKWRHLIENFFCKLRSSNASPCAATRPTIASTPLDTV
jgi:hypothetical protein